MTGEDDIIRAIDIPERMQIAQAGITPRPAKGSQEDRASESDDTLLLEDELPAAAVWCASRISEDLTKEFIQADDGTIPPLRDVFTTAVQRVLHFLCVDYFEVPFIWVHRRDYFIHRDETSDEPSRSRALLGREDLWKIYNLAVRYRALLDKKAHLLKLWQKLHQEDEYFMEAFNSIDSPEEAADLVEWVSMKYQTQLKEMSRAAGAELIPEEEASEVNNRLPSSRYKRSTGASRYEIAKNSLVAKFAEVGFTVFQYDISTMAKAYTCSKSPCQRKLWPRTSSLESSRAFLMIRPRDRRPSPRRTSTHPLPSPMSIASLREQKQS